MKKIISLALATIMSASILAGCSKNDPAIMSFYDIEITASEYAYQLKQALMTIESEFDEFQENLKEEFAEENADNPDAIFIRDTFNPELYFDDAQTIAIEALRELAVVRNMLETNGFSINKDDEATAKSLLEYYQQPYMYGGVQAYKNYMRTQGRTVKAWTLEEEYNNAYDRMLPYVFGYANSTDEELYEIYTKDFYNAAHVVLIMDSEGDPIEDSEEVLTKEEAEANNAELLAKAEEILARANSGEDFFELVAEFSEDSGQPELGYAFKDGGMIDVFNDAVLEIEDGEIYPEIVVSSFGYHIIKRLDASEGIFENYIEDVKVGNSSTVGQTAFDALLGNDTVPVYYDLYSEITISNYEDYIIID